MVGPNTRWDFPQCSCNGHQDSSINGKNLCLDLRSRRLASLAASCFADKEPTWRRVTRMQVFVPLTTFDECVRVLDNKRLFKQLLEAYQILNVILDRPKPDGTPRKGWKNHPAVKQWEYWPGTLLTYADAARRECDKRGIATEQMKKLLDELGIRRTKSLPCWWGDAEVHSSHRARLLQKDWEHYRQFKWREARLRNLQSIPYQWAIPSDKNNYELEIRPKPRLTKKKEKVVQPVRARRTG